MSVLSNTESVLISSVKALKGGCREIILKGCSGVYDTQRE